MLQTILSLVGFWDGPIDGVWTDELTQALMDFQTALGVEPTGAVDAATIAAFQQALANLEAGATPTTTAAPAATTVAPTTPAATTAAPAPGGEATVLVADSDLGQILTAADGMTVYLFMPDAQGTPTCTDACAQAWPPLTVDDAGQVTGGDGVDASLLGTVEHPERALRSRTTAGRSTHSQATPPQATPTVRVKGACGTCSTRPATRSATERSQPLTPAPTRSRALFASASVTNRPALPSPIGGMLP